MLRRLHSLPGLIAGVFLIVLSLSGAVLSLDPAIERAGATRAADAMTVADLASAVQAAVPGLARIDRHPNGAVTAGYATADAMGSVAIDPVTGAVLGPDDPSAFMGWVKALHRSFLIERSALPEDAGRATAGIVAGLMVLLAGTGLFLLVASQGGWRRIARPVRGGGAKGLHATLGRIVGAVLLLSAITGAWMSLTRYGFIDDGSANEPDFPFTVAGTAPAPVARLAALRAVPLADLRRLTFPQPGDPTDVFGLQTAGGSGYVDQATGEVLNWLPRNTAQWLWETIYMLHTGQGLWWFGLILGLGVAGVPVMSVTGTMVWWNRRRARPRIPANARPGHADTVILVGSEGGTTWGFAATLHAALVAAGHRVHTAPMNALPRAPQARRMLILTATYGDGAAPASASRFLDRLAAAPPACPVAVLGFGDRMYPQFCGFAETVQAALAAAGVAALLPATMIDRQSAVDFAAWGHRLGAALGSDLVLDHSASLPPMRSLRLISRTDYGEAVQAPATIFRFGPIPQRGWFGRRGLPRFSAGDLVGILPPGTDVPRLYSLASSRGDGTLDICVRKMAGGVCSTHLHALAPGDTVQAFIRPNPAFRPQSGRAPVILVAAGCGIGPMAGFLRRIRPGRDTALYFGARDPASDYLYQTELTGWQAEGRLARLKTAFSRVAGHAYVQDRLREDAIHLRGMIERGGQVLVCGGVAMARAVAAEVDAAIVPLGLTVAALRAEGRYLEDVY